MASVHRRPGGPPSGPGRTHWDAPNFRPIGEAVVITEARQPMAGTVLAVTRLGYLVRCADGVDRQRVANDVYDPEADAELTFVIGHVCPLCHGSDWAAAHQRDGGRVGRCVCGARGPILETTP